MGILYAIKDFFNIKNILWYSMPFIFFIFTKSIVVLITSFILLEIVLLLINSYDKKILNIFPLCIIYRICYHYRFRCLIINNYILYYDRKCNLFYRNKVYKARLYSQMSDQDIVTTFYNIYRANKIKVPKVKKPKKVISKFNIDLNL